MAYRPTSSDRLTYIPKKLHSQGKIKARVSGYFLSVRDGNVRMCKNVHNKVKYTERAS